MSTHAEPADWFSRERDSQVAARSRSSAEATTKPPRPPAAWIYRNLTPWRIEYRVDPRDVQPALTIPPLGETVVVASDCDAWNTSSLRQRGQLEIVPAPGDVLERLPSLILLLGWAGVVFTSVVWAILGGVSAVPVKAMCVLLVVVPGLALVAASARELVHGRQYQRYRDVHDNTCSNQGLNTDQAGSTHDSLASQVGRRVAEVVVLVGSLAVAVGGPALAIYHTSQLRQVLPFDFSALLDGENPFAGATSAASDSSAVWQLLVGHMAQWILVSVAALVPAAMYFQFDRERLAAIQGRWVRQVFRLDPTMRSLGDIQAKYGAQIESSFGQLAPGSSTRQARGRRSPVVVATILITIGWIVLATGAEIPQLVESTDGHLVWPDDGKFPVVSFFLPQGTALGFAFLGAYVFTLFHVVRAYQRRDLVPKTYNTIVVRILAAYVLTLAADTLLANGDVDNRVVIAFAFFAGFLPQSALVSLREKLTNNDPRNTRRYEVLDEKAPLTELEGIDLYDRTRLSEEGINNVHALAHADIVELMSSTRISADRLVDWTDQAILFLRAGGDPIYSHVDADSQDPGDGDALTATRANMQHLRHFGIRNASDLLQAFETAALRGEQSAVTTGLDEEGKRAAIRAATQHEVDQLRNALSVNGLAPAAGGYLPIQGMLDTLPDEEWFTQIRNWRTSEFGAAESWCWYIDGDWPYPKMPDSVPARVSYLRDRQLPRSFPMAPPGDR